MLCCWAPFYAHRNHFHRDREFAFWDAVDGQKESNKEINSLWNSPFQNDFPTNNLYILYFALSLMVLMRTSGYLEESMCHLPAADSLPGESGTWYYSFVKWRRHGNGVFPSETTRAAACLWAFLDLSLGQTHLWTFIQSQWACFREYI